jgi:peptidoglycan/xylan/chitin deacetylase (PgdA/CDA1 family)
MYHDVDVRPGRGVFAPYVVHPRQFVEHMAALAESGYTTAPISALGKREQGDRKENKIAYLTFDDAYATFHHTVLPALAEKGMTATVFVPTNYVGRTAGWMAPDDDSGRPLATWTDLSDVLHAGSEVGAHGHRHVALDLLAPGAVRDELIRSRRRLQDELGIAGTSMAYPFGHSTASVRREAARVGYTVACAVADDLQPLSGDLLRVRRILVSSTMSAEDLVAVLRGPPRRAINRALRAGVRPGWRGVRRLQARRERR